MSSGGREAATGSGDVSAEAIAGDLRSRIHRGELGPGDRLPAERDLADTYGVGRLRVRDALAALEAEGYVETRRGATGGRFVTGLGRPFRAWADRMRADADELDDIVDFRLAVECQAARFAAERRRARDLTALRRSLTMLEAAADPRSYRLADVAFHRALATASGSPRLAAAVERARGELFEPADALWEDDDAARSLRDHAAIVVAVEARDADAAAAAMAMHIELTRREIRALLAPPGRSRAR